MSRMLRSGMGVLVGAAGVGGALIPASPASAHFVEVYAPGGGVVGVQADHYRAVICDATVEFRMSTLAIHRRSNSQCAPYSFGERIVQVRVCDPGGCTGWKDV
jgi:hypothetical protein